MDPIFAESGCPCNQRLRWHSVSIVNDYTDTMSAWLTTALTPCQLSQQLRGHQHSHWLRRHMSAKSMTIMIHGKLFSKIMGPRSGWLRGNAIFELCELNIFAKTKKFSKLFLPVYIGPRSNMLSKKICRKSRDTVPLMNQNGSHFLLKVCKVLW